MSERSSVSLPSDVWHQSSSEGGIFFQCGDERNAITSSPGLLTPVPFHCRLAAIVRSSNDAIISTSLNGEIQTWNEGAERIYGYAAPEVIGQSITILDPEGKAGPHQAVLEAVRHGREVRDFEVVQMKQNGGLVTVHLRGSPIFNEEGAVVGASSVARDISAQKDAEESLRESEEQYRLLFKDNPVPMWVFDRYSLRFLAVNEAAISRYGYSETEFQGMSITDIRPPEEIPNLLRDFKLLGPGLQQPGLWKHRRKDGTIIDVEIVVHDLNYNGHAGELVAAYDVTERLRSQSLLRESEEKYRVLFENSSDAYLLFSDDEYVDCNAAALKMFGFSKVSDFTHPADISPPHQADGVSSREAVGAKIANAFSGSTESFEWLHRRNNGEIFPAEVRLSPLQVGQRSLLMATIRDISGRRRNEMALKFKTALLEAQSETTTDGILAVDERQTIILANGRFRSLFGIPQKMLDSHDDRAVRTFVTAQIEDPDAFLEKINYLYGHTEERSTDEIRLLDGRSIERYSAPLKDADGHHQGRIWYFRDISLHKKAEATARQAEESYRTIFENSVIGIFRATPEARLITVNRALAHIHGFDTAAQLFAEISNDNSQLFVNPEAMADLVKSAATGRKVDQAEIEVYTRTGARRWMRVSCQAVRDDAGTIRYVDGTAEDITDRKLAEERVESLAYFDTLTGLPNRLLFHDRIGQALARTRRTNEKIAVFFIDLDHFKFINDSLGHTVGDMLLKQIAGRLERCIRDGDTVARIGGDEFVVLMENISGPDHMEAGARRIIDEFSSGIDTQGHLLHMTCSIGISVCPDNGCDEETLTRYADQAMYSAKENGRNTYRFFSAELNDQIQRRVSIEYDLRLALERDELFLTYQPQMVIETGELAGFEVLLRWQHPEKGLIPPDSFIEIAENSGLILPIGDWVLRTACSQARDWLDMDLFAVPVSVNISAVQFRQQTFCAQIAQILGDTGLPPEFLELELTESLLLSNRESMLSVLQQLKTLGVRLAIDDFGTGYSSLSYLKQFHVQKLKIDRSFVRDIATDMDDAAITAAIIDMGKNLNLRVIAEGVEEKEQLDFLREHRCDDIQGYIFSKPLDASAMEVFLRDARRHRLNPRPGRHDFGLPHLRRELEVKCIDG